MTVTVTAAATARPSTEDRRGAVLAATAVALVALPIVVATVRAIHQGWIPIGDDAFFAVRARDVLTPHHPLVGTWTSASTSVGVDINNPGPLFFDLLALPTKLFGAAGLAAAVATMNIASATGIAVVAWRRGRAVAAIAAMVMAAGLTWTMGSELLYDAWQPNSLLLPFLLLLVLVWAVLAGDLVALPWVVGVASFLVQTHFSYALLVALVCGLAAVAFVVEAVRRGDRRRTGRLVATSVVVGLVCWIQPLIDQVGAHGFGNLAKLLAHAGGAPTTIGGDLGLRLVAAIVSVPPFWGRPSFEKGLVLLGRSPLPSTAGAGLSLLAVVALLAACLAWSVRRRDRDLGTAAGLGIALVAGGLVTAFVIPLGIFAVAPHQLRWLWPIATFVTFVLVLAVARSLAGNVPELVRAAALLLAVAVLAVANVPAYNARTGPSADADSLPSARRLLAQLGPLEGRGPLLLDTRGVRFADPYFLAVMAELQRRSIEFRVDEPTMVHQLGRSRAADGSERARLFERDREEALSTPPGATLVARVVGLSPRGRSELERLRTEVAAYVEAHGLRLNAKGRAAAAIGALHDVPPSGEVTAAEPFVRGDDFVLLVRQELADLDPATRRTFVRYTDLLEEWQKRTVAVFVEPLP